MKILYLVHQFYPEWYTGTEKFVMNLATMMQKCGNKVKVMTYGYGEDIKDSSFDQSIGSIIYKEFIYKGIPVLALKHQKIPKDIHHALSEKELAKVAKDLINREKPDIVHVGHSMRLGNLVRILPGLNIPYIVTLTDFFLICPKYNLITSKNTLCSGPKGGNACQSSCPEFPIDSITSRLEMAREVLFNAKIVVSPSRFLAGMVEKEVYGLDIKIVNHGLKYSTVKRNEKSYTKGDRIVFCYAGSLNHHKGVHILIDAFKKVGSNNTFLKIYGSGPDDSYVSSLMTMAKKDRRIEFCDVFQEDRVGEILSHVDVVITPSLWYENYPLVLHEALACNVPVIATDIGGMAEKIKDGVNGFLFRLAESQHLKEVLQMIADNPPILDTVKHNNNNMMIPTVEQEAYTYERIYVRLGTNKRIGARRKLEIY